ncbi:hypothetical protein BDQ17DRAFT_1336057 [Cyathus striatus]|nr:hypothetical protein BDQ17DRAFT_1336057 [Cyathus striatus]
MTFTASINPFSQIIGMMGDRAWIGTVGICCSEDDQYDDTSTPHTQWGIHSLVNILSKLVLALTIPLLVSHPQSESFLKARPGHYFCAVEDLDEGYAIVREENRMKNTWRTRQMLERDSEDERVHDRLGSTATYAWTAHWCDDTSTPDDQEGIHSLVPFQYQLLPYL